MPEKTKNPFVVVVESDPPTPVTTTADKPEPIVKMVIKPDSSTFVKIVPEKPSIEQNLEGKPEETRVVLPKKQIEKEVDADRTKIQWGMFFAGVFVTLVVVGISGGLWWAQNNRVGLKSVVVAPSPSPTAIAQATPTPPAAGWARESIKVDVLNASGVTGKASEIATQIQKLGYKKGETGNANTQTGSTVSFSQDTASLSAVIKEDLGSIISSLAISNDVVKGTGTIRVVIGK